MYDNKDGQYESILEDGVYYKYEELAYTLKFPLVMACIKNKINEVERICEKNSDLEKRRYDDGYTPLFYACLRGHTKIVELLLSHGANKKCNNNINELLSKDLNEEIRSMMIPSLQKSIQQDTPQEEGSGGGGYKPK